MQVGGVWFGWGKGAQRADQPLLLSEFFLQGFKSLKEHPFIRLERQLAGSLVSSLMTTSSSSSYDQRVQGKNLIFVQESNAGQP